jgi:hypothetical protein
MFENRVLKTVFGFKSEEMKGGWRKLYNEKVHNLLALLVFGTWSIFKYFEQNTLQKLDLFPSSGESTGSTYLVGSVTNG